MGSNFRGICYVRDVFVLFGSVVGRRGACALVSV